MSSPSTSTAAWLWLPHSALWFVEHNDEAWLECSPGTCHAVGRTSYRLRRALDTDIADNEVRGKEEGERREKCRLAFIQHAPYRRFCRLKATLGDVFFHTITGTRMLYSPGPVKPIRSVTRLSRSASVSTTLIEHVWLSFRQF